MWGKKNQQQQQKTFHNLSWVSRAEFWRIFNILNFLICTVQEQEDFSAVSEWFETAVPSHHWK